MFVDYLKIEIQIFSVTTEATTQDETQTKVHILVQVSALYEV